MTIEIAVRDYRGAERADITLAPIALVAGRNEAGKSCIAQAVRAVLTGNAIPIPGVAKKDAKLLVRDGADKGSVSVSWPANGNACAVIEWPKCDIKGKEGNPCATEWSVGLRHLFDLNDAERANVLAGYIDSLPCVTDLASAMRDIGYGDKAIDQTWASVNVPGGWDDTHKKAREYSATLKGKWEGITSEKWGAKKGEDWLPAGWDDAIAAASLEDLAAAAGRAETEYDRVVGLAAVSNANTTALQEKAATIADLEVRERELRQTKDELFEAHRELKVATKPVIPSEPMTCPCCKAALELDKGTLIEAASKPTKKEIAAATKALEAHNQAIADAGAAFDKAYAEHREIENQLKDARRAKLELEAISKKGGGTATIEDVDAARAAMHATQKAVAMKQTRDQAAGIHAQIVKNLALVDILAPDGLRRRKLASSLEVFNAELAKLCDIAKWPTVRLDENLQPHYGTRPVWAASASGQWRARVIVQIAMALSDGSAAVVIDEADILDARGRNSLFAMLKQAGVSALVCMTINKPDLVPDLAKAGIGASYWIEGGIAGAIGAEQEAA